MTLASMTASSLRQDGRVSVSIVTHGHGALLLNLLDDLATHSAESVGEVICTRNFPEVLDLPTTLPFPIRVVDNPSPQGFSTNHNRAFALARCRHFAVLNPDLRFSADPFPPLMQAVREVATAIAAPLVLDTAGCVADSARRLVTPWQVVQRRFSQHNGPIPVNHAPDWIAGMFLLFRCEVFEQLQGFDERYFLYCEDVDICARARLAGMNIALVPDVPVTHFAQRASRRSPRQFVMHLSSLLRLWRSQVFWRYRRLLAARRST